VFTSKKIEELGSLRGIAACLVVIYHIPLWNPINNFSLIRNGYLMVPLFFVLSGFVIYKSYSSNLNNKKDILRFMFLRFGRLYPVHITFLLIFIFIEAAKWYAQNNYGVTSPNSYPFRLNNATAFLKNIFLLQAFTPEHTFNGPAWSISAEFYTYFLFALLVVYLEKIKNITIFALSAGSLYLLFCNYELGLGDFLSCTSGFFLGCNVSYCVEKVKITLPKYSSLVVFVGIVFFLIFKQDPIYDPIMYFLAAFLILTLIANRNTYLNKLLRLNFFTWLGSISFSIYMSHLSVIWITNQFIRVVLSRPCILINGQSTPQLNNSETFIAVVFIIITVLIVSALTFKFIENPLRLVSRRYAYSELK
jgi:peptidoglycan/LPS O-acetylase OafA/YrhL